MKKLITTLCLGLIGGMVSAQWIPAKPDAKVRTTNLKSTAVRQHYKLDLDILRQQLKNAQEMGGGNKAVVISIPTLNGKIEKFNVYSFPVLVKSLADRYNLGSYVGVGIDDPSKYLRFSVGPNDFQSIIIKGGEYEFIDPQNSEKTLYGVHPKTLNTEGKSFVCTTSESPKAVHQLQEMLTAGQNFTNQPTDFSKTSDKKYRTMRLAMSVTGEYTAFHGGTQLGAIQAVNATMTRVNAVFEKDLALHLNVLDLPGIIYTNAATDPYTGNLNLQLQQTLTANVGEENYDIGHVFNAAGNNGNAGCIGCVCISPTTTVPRGKGSAFTQSTSPVGDNFDIDFVAHEMGHQLGANHTFAHALEGSGVNMEPGSGTTIMGYAGITGANTDVQPHSDPFFHKASIGQIQTNLNSKTCDVETSITNNPPVIAPLPTYNIPKETAFVLTASATDPENDPITYMWEQIDNANVVINKTNIGTTTTGATFRSLVPTASPTRYFPKLSSVLNGVLDNSNNLWESVSKVARTTHFAVTVRDNNANPAQQQSQVAEQTIVVGNDGPFKINTAYANTLAPTMLEWNIANTNAAPYNAANVKIDYTIDNGTTWTILSASTANDGTENITLPTSLNGQNIKLRISAIGNVFYAVKSIAVSAFSVCDGSAPTNVTASNITTVSAYISWPPVTSAGSYKIRYKKLSETNWIEVTSTVNNVTLNNLVDGVAYEVQVAAVCSGTTGAYSPSTNFSTPSLTYCPATSISTNPDFEYISNVTIANVNNSSLQTNYGNYTTNSALQINLVKGTSYPLSVTVSNPDLDAVAAFIDFNRNGVFETTERVLSYPVPATPISAPVTSIVNIPSTAVENQPLRMRVLLVYGGTQTGGVITGACGNLQYGEVEDYNVVITSPLSTSDVSNPNNDIRIYPNPVSDILNVTKVSDKAAYKIYNTAGQLVGNGNINDGKINVSSLVKGGYVITIDEKGRDQFRSKFIKK
ncbi:propanediol utilization protein [Chryseobacterium elymi]|uniref:Propanediol utilization protein n=1 Tax=Chryseobacterium elymi TaxID=395936 RepID=A0A3D9DGH5_9FLAO|nr:zinc-dependent metalloprotease family protein [Chryseobacterium elymi]REC77107.1 propanediol utilization protein [Chryseobacterium elymi]